MSDTRNTPAAIGAALGCLGVGLGAFGAHGLEDSIRLAENAQERLEWWSTAAHYQLLHAVAIVATAAYLKGRRGAQVVPFCFTVGVAIFSGTLYCLALGAPRWFGAITPIGGVLLIAGWLVASLSAFDGEAAAVPSD